MTVSESFYESRFVKVLHLYGHYALNYLLYLTSYLALRYTDPPTTHFAFRAALVSGFNA